MVVVEDSLHHRKMSTPMMDLEVRLQLDMEGHNLQARTQMMHMVLVKILHNLNDNTRMTLHVPSTKEDNIMISRTVLITFNPTGLLAALQEALDSWLLHH